MASDSHRNIFVLHSVGPGTSYSLDVVLSSGLSGATVVTSYGELKAPISLSQPALLSGGLR